MDQFQRILRRMANTSSIITEPILSTPSSTSTKIKPVRLLKISLPIFCGDIMEWTEFWTQFSSAVDSDPDLDKVNKLTYLRDSIRDPTINPILFNGANNEHHYDEVGKKKKLSNNAMINPSKSTRIIVNSWWTLLSSRTRKPTLPVTLTI